MRINEKAVLVKLSIGMPGNTRKDLKITGKVIKANHLGDKAGRWLKALYPEEALSPVAKVAAEARTFHYTNTLPWTDEGYRLLPTANHADYCMSLRKLRQQFETLSETHFIARLSEWEAWAREQHNGTFDAADYLSAEKLRDKFGFSTEFTPIPSGADFRVDIGEADLAQMSAAVDERVQGAVKDAQQDLWARLAAPLRAIVDKLKETKPIFRDSLIGNVKDIVRLIPRLNLAGDSNLQALAVQVEKEIAGITPDALRASKPDRKAAAAAAQAILDKMSGYLGGAQ